MPEVELIYESEWSEVYHGRAEDWLTDTEGVVDLIVTDPPYGVSWRSNLGGNFDQIEGDDGTYDPLPVVGETVRFRLRPFRHLYVFGYDLSGMDEFQIGPTAKLVWDKGIIGPGNLSLPWGPQYEKIGFGVKVPSRKNRQDGKGRLSARLRQGSVVRVQRPNSRGVNRHPTEKPVDLLRQLIESSSIVGDVVLDLFAGSGSTGVAALLSGRRTILVEVNDDHARLCAERVQAAERLMEKARKL